MAGPQGKQRSGKGSRIQVNGTNLNQNRFDVDDSADRLDTTHFESGGFGQSTFGVETCKFNCAGDWDAHTNFLDSPPGIFPTDSMLNLKLYLSVTDNTFWVFPQACVFSAKNGAEVRGKVSFSWSGESNGSFTRATGSV